MEKKPRNCGQCKNYYFNWNSYGCKKGEQSVPTGYSTMGIPSTCPHYEKGQPHNQEY